MRTKFFVVLFVLGLASSAMLVTAARPAASGTITGKATFTGTPPKMKPIDMSKEPVCAKEHNPPITTQDIESGPGNTLQDVVVYISAGDQGSAPATTTAKYEQKGCQYMPHVLALQANQPQQIFNNDPVAHNIHPLPKANSEWNKSQPPGSPPIDTKWEKPEFIAVKWWPCQSTPIIEKCVGIEIAIAEEFVGITVKLISATLGLHNRGGPG